MPLQPAVLQDIDAVIRPFRPADLEAILAITLASFPDVSIDRNIEQEFGFVGGHDWRARKARDVQNDCEVNPTGVFVAERSGQVLGYVTTRVDPEMRIGRIPNVAVSETARSSGIGSTLIQRALDHLTDEGMAMARIETLEQNERGRSLYPRFGFREVARQIHYAAPLSPLK